MIKKVILAVMSVTVAATGFQGSAYAQEKIEEVTLTVSGDGATKQEATAAALRSAVEQAFGVFVSANTAILDDELVKDEIATVASGNIKKYDEIASAQLSNGNTAVTLKAVVSVSKLITYAQSKGSTAEFAGATFAMNMKLKELNKANEEKAIANMIEQLKALAPTMFDYKLELGEPKVGKYCKDCYELDAKVYVIFNNNTEMANNILLNTFSSLSLTQKEVEEYEASGADLLEFKIGNLGTPMIVKYSRPMETGLSPLYYVKEEMPDNRNRSYEIEQISSFLRSMRSKKQKEQEQKEQMESITGIPYFLRNKSREERQQKRLIADLLRNSIFNFEITDNLGNKMNITEIFHGLLSEYQYKNEISFFGKVSKNINHNANGISIIIRGDLNTVYERGFNRSYFYYDDKEALLIPHLFKEKLAEIDGQYVPYIINLTMEIPKDDISKYSNFTISNKNQ
jgi:hypothetical protein